MQTQKNNNQSQIKLLIVVAVTGWFFYFTFYLKYFIKSIVYYKISYIFVLR